MNIHRIVGASCLSALRPGIDWRPALDENQALGFSLVRVFCGALPWANQTIEDVYARLPVFLDYCRERGLHAYLSYITEAGTGYELERHVRELEAITAGRDNVLKEVANEATHPTQGGRTSPERCRDLAAMMAGTVGYGAAENDEALTYAGGHFVPVHLDRGRDLWNQVRRVREIEMASANSGKPAFNQEPIGAGEVTIAGKRQSDPAFFFALGALNRLMEVGGVFHSEDGLHARPLGPNQRRCAEAYISGARMIPDSPRLAYRNAGHDGSPVRAIRFNDGDVSKPGCTRAYSGIAGGEGYTVAVGISGDPGIEWNWRAEPIGGYSDNGTARVKVWEVTA